MCASEVHGRGRGAARGREVAWPGRVAEEEGRRERKGEKEKGRKKWKRGKRKGKKGEREERKREWDSRRHRRSVGHARRLGARERDARVEGGTRGFIRVSGQVLRGSADRNREVPGKLGLGF